VARAGLVFEYFANRITNSGVSTLGGFESLGTKTKFTQYFIIVFFCSRQHFEQSVTISTWFIPELHRRTNLSGGSPEFLEDSLGFVTLGGVAHTHNKL
jgi:hypothetical protein